MTLSAELITSQAQHWIQHDPDEQTRGHVRHLLATQNVAALRGLFETPLVFGTGGIRGVVGPGPARVNRLGMIRLASAVCGWLPANAQAHAVCVAYDGRLDSKRFAQDITAVLLSRGVRVFAFSQPVPTPLLAFSVRHQQAAAGLMVTASHNPPEYNGCKVFMEDGSQLIAPHDTRIASMMASTDDEAAVHAALLAKSRDESNVVCLQDEVIEAYIEEALADIPHRSELPQVSLAYSAFHGVGHEVLARAFERRRLAPFSTVTSQAKPDGTFPTLSSPNPEDRASLREAIRLGKEHDTDLVLANDPDADRLAVAVRCSPGEFEHLSGNDVGCLLADYLLTHTDAASRVLVSTVVSSPLLDRVASAYGVRCERTLTGFKWIAHALRDLRAEGLFPLLCYEEALGYGVGSSPRDKDGISAAVAVTEMARWCKARGDTLIDYRNALWKAHGVYLDAQRSFATPSPDVATRIVDRLRLQPPEAIGGSHVIAIEDFVARQRKTKEKGVASMSHPATTLVICELEGGHRVMVRPSGTEPKLKMYIDACAHKRSLDDSLATASRVRLELISDSQELVAKLLGDLS